ncbi:MAG: hypothetical protein BWY86_00466 [Candidatus Aminicenantes bacterium ADurb.Bin508]|nr:MAG: hypothetical protein BWY86_00466 [Candidatus Aminicenantes bacterium ADurb.Bin508]
MLLKDLKPLVSKMVDDLLGRLPAEPCHAERDEVADQAVPERPLILDEGDNLVLLAKALMLLNFGFRFQSVSLPYPRQLSQDSDDSPRGEPKAEDFIIPLLFEENPQHIAVEEHRGSLSVGA